MNIDERLNALTMNLELAVHGTADLRVSVESLRESVKELRESETDLKGSVTDLSDSVHALVTVTNNLVKLAESHERRLTRLEGLPQ